MEIQRDRTNPIYSPKNRALGNCFTVKTESKEIHYEFEIKGREALIITEDLTWIEEAIKEFRFYNFNITTFYTKDRSFYKSFDEVHIFKLPIKILQPSQFFIDRDKLKTIEENLTEKDIHIPVTILNEEYVALDGHTRLYYLYQNDVKMVNVYLDTAGTYIQDFVYMAKEMNIFNISALKLLSHEEYDIYWNKFCDDYFSNI